MYTKIRTIFKNIDTLNSVIGIIEKIKVIMPKIIIPSEVNRDNKTKRNVPQIGYVKYNMFRIVFVFIISTYSSFLSRTTQYLKNIIFSY